MEKKTNGMSIAAIIFAFIMPIVGLILAIIAKKNDPDDKLAKAAFIISIFILAIGLVSSIGCAACTACAAASMEGGSYAAVLAL